ncbi:proteasome assembly chaperone 1-like [Watersipora subatra]|uniref:proteasome assembly chaperone 1-like n=1 Tax=Watersipora subatra TaxID=2589382 RepID=UPI00355B4132
MSELGPSFYGEVLPVFSRAVDEEEDEDDAECVPVESSVLQWSPEALAEMKREGGLECGILVIAIDSVATGFVQTHLLYEGAERLGVLCSGLSDNCINTLDQESFTDETCYIYRLRSHPSILFCQCNTKVIPEQSSSWVQQLFSSVKSIHTYVAVLSHKSVSEYRSIQAPSQINVPFLRALKTTHFQGTPICRYLEQPNIIDGLPAQIITHCQVKAIPAVFYVCYTENIYLDIESLKEFTKLTATTPFRDFYVPNPNASEELRKLVDQKNKSNLLYM